MRDTFDFKVGDIVTSGAQIGEILNFGGTVGRETEALIESSSGTRMVALTSQLRLFHRPPSKKETSMKVRLQRRVTDRGGVIELAEDETIERVLGATTVITVKPYTEPEPAKEEDPEDPIIVGDWVRLGQVEGMVVEVTTNLRVEYVSRKDGKVHTAFANPQGAVRILHR